MSTVESEDRPLLLRPEVAAQRLSIGRTQLYKLISTGELDSVRIGRLRRIPAAACDDYVRKLGGALS